MSSPPQQHASYSPDRLTGIAGRLCLALCTGLFLWATLGCQPPRKPQREVFEQAEEAYQRGHYDKALESYESFLKAAPDHQLAPLAQQRVLSIERELEIVMGRRNGPRPIYLRPLSEQELQRARPPLR